MGQNSVKVTLQPGKVTTFEVPASGVRGFGDYDYLMTVRSSTGFVPHLVDPQSIDYRNLSAQLRFRPILAGFAAR